MSFTGSSCPPLWAIVDCNNFYASCEMLFRPDLAGRPVVVLSNNDGIVVARSPAAKELGIRRGDTEFKIRHILRERGVAVFSSNYSLYGDISSRVMKTIETVCPVMEQYSIDEAFIPLSGALAPQAGEVARQIRERVLQWTGITVSVGVAPTRTLAKIAGRIAKKGSGVVVLEDMKRVPEILRTCPVEDVWGIGKRQALRLRAEDVRFASGLAALDDRWLLKHLTVTGLRTALELRGQQAVMTEDLPVPRRTLVASRSFGRRISDVQELCSAVSAFAARAAERLRREGLTAGGIAVFARSSRYDEDIRHEFQGQRLFPGGTADTNLFQKAACEETARQFRHGVRYAKAGVMLFELGDRNRRQMLLLPARSEAEEARRAGLMAVMDGINTRFGRGKIRFGAEGLDDGVWRARQEYRSPRMTTCWDEIPVVKC